MVENGKKRRRAAYQPTAPNKRRRHVDLRQHGYGVLVTSGTSDHTREAMKEALTILERGVAADSTAANPSLDVLAAVDAELESLKEEERRFIPIHDFTKGVNFIQFNSVSTPPNVFVFDLLSGIASRKPASPSSTEAITDVSEPKAPAREKVNKIGCRFLSRMVPVELTCPPHPDSFLTAARRFITAYFPESHVALHPEEYNKEAKAEDKPDDKKLEESRAAAPESESVEAVAESGGAASEEPPLESAAAEAAAAPSGRSFKAAFVVPKNARWAVQWSKRSGMKTLDRDFVINEVAKLVGANYTVNLTQPEYCVLIELNQVFCGFSLAKDYLQLMKYNVHRLCHPETASKK